MYCHLNDIQDTFKDEKNVLEKGYNRLQFIQDERRRIKMVIK